jgi:hypothetical protein
MSDDKKPDPVTPGREHPDLSELPTMEELTTRMYEEWEEECRQSEAAGKEAPPLPVIPGF